MVEEDEPEGYLEPRNLRSKDRNKKAFIEEALIIAFSLLLIFIIIVIVWNVVNWATGMAAGG